MNSYPVKYLVSFSLKLYNIKIGSEIQSLFNDNRNSENGEKLVKTNSLIMAVSVVKSNIMNLTRSLEKILEESTLSGELKLNNRSIKEFPKNIAKYNLNDLVYAGN